ncbi:MarR family transcriptional regulator [Ameyamaea chiangmaiensis NBRC 103196]|uniref:MarR family transcriptional regulator n=1 Tax=Ameyamaea chiangmaiensis TaxID=442969 RepID=A0A850PDW9_9PROT|nr:MarR family transcriptional regulator [Ameyamaea chiangmaiensis]MBS4074495.1 MarR family transcriptional regulator [Ameyamaea chiangmaiensis]NVN39241.1 MarR family transcriptional regulator [Ameyamaea chiangmaiensis]GBQ72246.1 MarR family transcriptional regulator [Ameyamaea chiangmaiensis NBRC 103196]
MTARVGGFPSPAPRKAHEAAGAGHLFLREDYIRQAQQVLLSAWQELNACAEPVREAYGIGRAHQRVLHVVGSRPGLTVGALLQALGITKQSLGRVLDDLEARGLVVMARGRQDRRHKVLSLSPSGIEAEQALFDAQRERLVEAYRTAGAASVEGFRRVLGALLEPAAPTKGTDAGARPSPGRTTRG